MGEFYSVGELGRILDVTPWRISDLFYRRHVPDVALVGGVRMIPKALVPEIAEKLRERGIHVNRTTLAS